MLLCMIIGLYSYRIARRKFHAGFLEGCLYLNPDRRQGATRTPLEILER